MDKATQTMIENLHKNTGKTLEQWIDIVKEQNFAKHGEIVKFLKEHFKPIYDKLITEIQTYGKDIEVAPKNTYVSLRRNKQFATLNPATKTRFEIGINLKGQEPKGKLEAEKPNSMCSHKINITDIKDIDKEVFEWIRTAYDNAR